MSGKKTNKNAVLAEVQRVVAIFYEKGCQRRSYSAIYRAIIKPNFNISIRTFWRWIKQTKQ